MKTFTPKKQTLIWNDIRSGHKPNKGRMLYILVGHDICIGGYEVNQELVDGKPKKCGHFWNGDEYNNIPDEEITAWAYMDVPDFEE